MDDDTMTNDGERSARRLPAVLLSFAAPGLGLFYVGRPVAGLVVHALCVLVALLFLIAATIFDFFPVFPALVIATGGLVLCSLTAWHCLEIIDEDSPTRQRAYHHPLMYALVALMTFLGPLAVTANFAWRNLVTVVPVEQPTMYPQVHDGDRLLIDRRIYRNDAPQRGDLVALRLPETEELAILRVVALPGDQVSVHGFTVVVNDQVAHYSPLESKAMASADAPDSADLELWVEQNHDRRYVISLVPGASPPILERDIALDDNQYFVLADNRAMQTGELQGHPPLSDSRYFGAIDGSRIVGRPTYVAWSASPDDKSTRWDRIGLPVH
jgi:signal peptidase I